MIQSLGRETWRLTSSVLPSIVATAGNQTAYRGRDLLKASEADVVG